MKNKEIIIGITLKNRKDEFYIPNTYISAFSSRGAGVILIPYIIKKEYTDWLVDSLSGLVLAGGGDISPEFYGTDEKEELKNVNRERDLFEIEIVKAFSKTGKPLLGICRGMQVINVSFGGSIYQDIKKITKVKHWQKEPPSQPTHYIKIKNNTKLSKIFKKDVIKVNSIHHQAVKELADGFVVSALSEDEIIEAIEHREHPYLIGVQFHPEYMHNVAPFSYLFDSFIEKVKDESNKGRYLV